MAANTGDIDGPSTAQWVQAFGISSEPTLPAVSGYDEACPFTAREIAVRAVILHGLIAIAFGVDPEPIIAWLTDQNLWEAVSPAERAFAADPSGVGQQHLVQFRSRQEAEWALLWTVGMVDHLGLPTRRCDTGRLVDEIVPTLGANVEPFLTSARLRSPGELLAEEDRHYNLWCRYVQARRTSARLPTDLLPDVLFQREYVFEWLNGSEEWDNVHCDS